MLDELMKALERDNQEWIFYEEGRVVVDIMVKAVRPSMPQSAVKKQIQLQRNKPLRTDVFRFVRLLRTFAAGNQMYGGVEDEDKFSKFAKDSDSRGQAPKRPDEKRPDGGAGPAKPRSSGGVERPDEPLAPARKPAACLQYVVDFV
ncbi:hypothetical protein H310_11358 [Aphanomyces invadans]|uniref:Uncharacterized protein n=1 Tax=Aphanomyces invadans TaxID=157072 RepID=A0A024TM46_9STRA|nr:hypothetical protein H310_11358 [Aphanomyces invadans]ETV95064.1 hypothetical protein H310_11358 [Aphanomyces invadans]|eukprot:XP_008876237.1 hypothetical protein H310_11358 [Aphanomyces invadans]